MSVVGPPAFIAASAFRPFLFEFVRAVRSIDLRPVTAVGVSRVDATSWWRGIEENRRVGGDPFSQHLVGLAVDVALVQNTARGRSALIASAARAGLRGVDERDHVHLQLWPAGQLRRLVQGA